MKNINILKIIKKFFSDNIKIGKIKILIQNLKDNFEYKEVVVFNEISEKKQKRNRKKLWWNFSLATSAKRRSKN